MINVWILLLLLPGDNRMIFAAPINKQEIEQRKHKEEEDAAELLLALKSSRSHEEQVAHAQTFLTDEITDEDLLEELTHSCDMDDEEEDYFCVFFICKKAEFMHWCDMGAAGFFCVDEPTEEIYFSFIDENDGLGKTVNVTKHFEKDRGVICKEHYAELFDYDDK